MRLYNFPEVNDNNFGKSFHASIYMFQSKFGLTSDYPSTGLNFQNSFVPLSLAPIQHLLGACMFKREKGVFDCTCMDK